MFHFCFWQGVWCSNSSHHWESRDFLLPSQTTARNQSTEVTKTAKQPWEVQKKKEVEQVWHYKRREKNQRNHSWIWAAGNSNVWLLLMKWRRLCLSTELTTRLGPTTSLRQRSKKSETQQVWNKRRNKSETPKSLRHNNCENQISGSHIVFNMWPSFIKTEKRST